MPKSHWERQNSTISSWSASAKPYWSVQSRGRRKRNFQCGLGKGGARKGIIGAPGTLISTFIDMKVMWVIWATSLWAVARAAPTPQQFNAELVAHEGIPAGHQLTSITHAEPLRQIIAQSPDPNQPLNLDDILRQLTGSGGSIVSANFVQGPNNPTSGNSDPSTASFTQLQVNAINRQGLLGSGEDLLPIPDSGQHDVDDSAEFADLRIVSGPGFYSPGVTSGGDVGFDGGVALGGGGVSLDTGFGGGGGVALGGGSGVALGGGGGEASLGGQSVLSSAVSSGPSDGYLPPSLTLATPNNEYLPPPTAPVTVGEPVVKAPEVVVTAAKPALPVVTKPAITLPPKTALPVITKPAITLPPKTALPVITLPSITIPPKPIVSLPIKPTISTSAFAKPFPTLSPNALGALLGGLTSKIINPTQTLGSLLRGLNGQDGIVVVDINSREDSSLDLDDFSIDTDPDEDDSLRITTGSDSASLGGGSNGFSLGGGSNGFSLGGGSNGFSLGGSTVSLDAPATTAVTATTKKPLGPKFLFQGPLSDILLTKGQWLGTLIGGLVDIGGTVVRSFNKTPLF